VERLSQGECPGFAKETTMLKGIGLTALATAAAVLTLGCVRGLVSPTAPVQDQIYMTKPMSAPAGIISSEATILWRDIGIYRASGPLRMVGPMYAVTSYETKAECEAAQQAAMAKEALSRVGPTTEQLSDGIKSWASDRLHYTTFRYRCRLAVTGPAPVR
jgi:hypothetical protein